MNWLEAIFHYSPDHGDGTAEVLLLLMSVAAVVAAMVRNRRRNQMR